METWIYYVAVLAVLLVGFSLGTVVSDYLATKYWEKEISRIKKMHESETTSTTVASFNRGVLAALPSKEENDKDIPNNYD